VRRRELSATLRRLRTQAGLTLDEAAAHLETSAATLSRIETGVRIPRARDVRDLVALYGVKDEKRVAEIVGLVAEAREPGWWEAYSEISEGYATLIGFEGSATRIQQYEGLVIPGLLQAPQYGRVYLRQAIAPGWRGELSDREIEQRVEIRVRRQQAILSPPGVPYEVIVDEAALRRQVGGPAVMRDQIRRIVEIMRVPHVSVRMLPFSVGAHPGQPGGFTILTMPQTDVSDIVYVDSLAGQLFLEGGKEVQRHRQVWAVLYERALDEEQTLEALLDMVSAGGPNEDTPTASS
jgi:transcriptional regulator with XRE-family HTH domain